MARPLVYFCVFGPQWKKFEHPWYTRIMIRKKSCFFTTPNKDIEHANNQNEMNQTFHKCH